MHTGLSASLVDLSDLIHDACDDFPLFPALYLVLAFVYRTQSSLQTADTLGIFAFFPTAFMTQGATKLVVPPFLLSRIEFKLFTNAPKQAYRAIHEQLTAARAN